MHLTFVTETGQTYPVDIDPSMELEDAMALLESESGVAAAEQSLYYNGNELTNRKATMEQLGMRESNEMILFRKKVANPAGPAIEQDAEMMRLQILGDPTLMQQLRETQPEVAEAAQSNPSLFAELLRQTQNRHHQAELARQREVELLHADPFDVEAQRKIEEAIRHQAVLENMEHALEYSPESFGRVTMLYIPLEVNSTPVKAFVDSGAQQTIMSPECAEACGIMRLLDKRFSGIARGVGTAKILGRVHSAPMKLADLHLPCSFTIMEGRDVDLLFGLDMLKAHQACIDLEKNCLRIKGREVNFLSEHQLPDKAREELSSTRQTGMDPLATNSSTSNPPTGASFPGSGHRLGGSEPQRVTPQPTSSRFSEDSIRTLVNLGATREQAISTLEAANGNLDLAASMLF